MNSCCLSCVTPINRSGQKCSRTWCSKFTAWLNEDTGSIFSKQEDSKYDDDELREIIKELLTNPDELYANEIDYLRKLRIQTFEFRAGQIRKLLGIKKRING